MLSDSPSKLLAWHEGAKVGGKVRATTGLALNELADALSAEVAAVPKSLDADVYAVLALAAAPKMQVGQAVAKALRHDVTNAGPALRILDDALGDRKLVVDRLDRLSSHADEVADVGELRRREVREWLSKRATVTVVADASADRLPVLPRPAADWDTAALWRDVREDAEVFVLAAASRAWLGVLPSAERLEAAPLVLDLWQGVPTAVREVLEVLIVHGRPIPRSLVLRAALVDADALAQAMDGWLVEEVAGALRLSPPWYQHAPVPAAGRGRLHRRVGDALAQAAANDAADDSCLAVLEAHRHYMAQPDIARAREFARFGATLLLDHARQESAAEHYKTAAEEYDAVLKLDDDARSDGADALGRRGRAYAVHYGHFNRARVGIEDLSATRAGYRSALDLWPENALFWSRFVRCHFLAGDWSSAVGALHDAYEKVPAHPNRDTVLVIRTAERLLERGEAMPALVVATERPVPSEQSLALAKLWASLASGSPTTRLWVPGAIEVRLEAPSVLKLERQSDSPRWCAEWAGWRANGSGARDAVRGLASSMLAEIISALENAPVEASGVANSSTVQVDLAWAASASEDWRWVAGLQSLRRRAASGKMPVAQCRAVISAWNCARERVPGLRRPAIGPTSDERAYYLSWAYSDVSVAATIEFEPDGSCEWWTTPGGASGTGVVEAALDAVYGALVKLGS